MPLIRPAVAAPFPSFGRRSRAVLPRRFYHAANTFGEDVRLFAMTFAAGFLFTSVYIA